MLHFDEIVFGPIKSRRLGSSLGINLLPPVGKLCNFDCIYCECGWNADGRTGGNFPSVESFRKALEWKLETAKNEQTPIDSITFSGNGEPTLHPEFGEIIDITLELRDMFYPKAKVSVLSNATRVNVPEVFQALSKVDNPIMKIDASTDDLVSYINKPTGKYSLEKVIDGLKKFNGDFILQTMFLDSPEFSTAEKQNMQAWYEIVRILHPREIMVYTIDRQTPQKKLVKYSVEEMKKLVKPLEDEGFIIQVRG